MSLGPGHTRLDVYTFLRSDAARSGCTPVEQLLAIMPDPEPVALENKVIELDVPQPARPAEPTA